jgi:hypothetical protein
MSTQSMRVFKIITKRAPFKIMEMACLIEEKGLVEVMRQVIQNNIK